MDIFGIKINDVGMYVLYGVASIVALPFASQILDVATTIMEQIAIKISGAMIWANFQIIDKIPNFWLLGDLRKMLQKGQVKILRKGIEMHNKSIKVYSETIKKIEKA